MGVRNRAVAKLAGYIEADGQVDPDTGLAFTLPLDAEGDGFVTATSIAGLPSSGNDFGRIGIVNENGSEEGKMVFWNGSAWQEEVSYTEWGGLQNPPAVTAVESSTPNFGGSQYFEANASVTANSTKTVGTDPIASYLWSRTSGENVTISNSTSPTCTLLYPNSITSDTSTTVKCVVTDNQGQTTESNSVTISWRADNAPTISSFTTSAGSTEGNAPEPGDTVTLTVTASDPESQSLSYNIYRKSGQLVTLNGSGNTRTFTVPEYDDGVNDYHNIVFGATVSDGSNTSAESTVTVICKRSPRVGHNIELVAAVEYQRSSTDGSKDATTCQPSYPSGLQEGDVLVMFVSMYSAPSFQTWDGIGVGGSYPSLKGDDLNNSGNTGYSTSSNPNEYRGSPYVVSNQGWERAYNKAINTPTSTPTTYERVGHGGVQVYTNGSYRNSYPAQDCFYKICDGNESGTIEVWDGFDASYGYAHAHHGENVHIWHLRLKSSAGVTLAVSDVLQIYADPEAWSRQDAIQQTSGSNHKELIFRKDNVDITDNPFFVYLHAQASGNSSYIISEGSNTGLNDGLFTNSYTDYNLNIVCFETGDGSFNNTFGPNYMQEFTSNDDTEAMRVQGSEFWRGPTSGADGNNSLGSTGGEYIYALSAVIGTCIEGPDVNRVTTRDIDFRHTKRLSGTTNRESSGNVGILQLIALDDLYS